MSAWKNLGMECVVASKGLRSRSGSSRGEPARPGCARPLGKAQEVEIFPPHLQPLKGAPELPRV